MIRTYSELSKLQTFEERFKYLKLGDRTGVTTFGFDRYLNQMFYSNPKWKEIRREIIMRDNGFEMGLKNYPINGSVYVHHMNPISIRDLEEWREYLIEPEYLVSVSFKLHNAIHFGDGSILTSYEVVERSPNDTKLW